MWARIKDAANSAYDRCSFTTFVANEWSDSFDDAGSGAANLHRNIIYATDSVPELAIDSLTYPTAPEMWAALEQQCRPEQGCDAIAIPHSHQNVRKLRFACFRRSLGRRGKKAWRVLLDRGSRERRLVESARAMTRAFGARRPIPVIPVEHHIAHAASAFFFSGMPGAAVLTVDGEGELTTTLFGDADHHVDRFQGLGGFDAES